MLKTKTIDGVVHRYCGNTHANPKPWQVARDLRETHEQAWARHRAMLADAVLLDPEPTEACTVEELKAMGLKSMWKPMTEGTKC